MNGLDKVIEHLNHAHLDALLNPPTNDMILEHLKKELELQWVKRSASKEEAFYLMLYHFSMPIR